MSQTRKAVAALFAVTVSTAVGIGYIHHEQTEERKVRAFLGRPRAIPCRITRLDLLHPFRDASGDGSGDGTFPRRSYIDVRAAQRASKLTRPVLPSPESPANRSLENSLDNRSSTRASSGTRSC